MNVKLSRRYEMLVRVDRFGKEHPDVSASSAAAASLFADVATALRDAADAGNAQIVARGYGRQGSGSIAIARTALLASLATLRRTLQALSVDDPAIMSGFRMPDSKRILTLWIAARVFALRARRRADALAARGLPPAFLDELDAQIADFGEVIALKKAGARMHNAALVQAETAVEAGRKAVRRLDGVVFNACHDNPRVLAAWDTARRIVYARPAAKAAA